jgi:hypothetical protein
MFLKYSTSSRERCCHSMAIYTAARPDELLSLRIKEIEFRLLSLESRVLEFNWQNWSGIYSSIRIYDITFEVDTFNALMKHAFGPFEDAVILAFLKMKNTIQSKTYKIF